MRLYMVFKLENAYRSHYSVLWVPAEEYARLKKVATHDAARGGIVEYKFPFNNTFNTAVTPEEVNSSPNGGLWKTLI